MRWVTLVGLLLLVPGVFAASDINLTGVIDAAGFYESGSPTLSASISGSASDVSCTDCLDTAEISDVYLLNSGDTATGNYTFDSGLFFIDSTNDGIGIGTSEPDFPLHIEGSGNQQIQLNSTGEARSVIRAFGERDGAGEIIFTMRGSWNGTDIAEMHFITGDDTANYDDGDIAFYTATGGTLSEAMRITQEGYVGVGTTSPNALLHVYDNTGSDPRLTIDADSGGGEPTLYLRSGPGKLTYSTSINVSDTSDNVAMFIDSSEQVGIGTDSPSAALDVHVVDGEFVRIETDAGLVGDTVGINFNSRATAAYGDTFSLSALELVGIDKHVVINTNQTNLVNYIVLQQSEESIRMGTSGAEVVRITSSGEVGIGTTAPERTLHVNSGITNDVAVFTSSDGTAFIRTEDNVGNYSFGGSSGSLYINNGDSLTGNAEFRIESDDDIRIGGDGQNILFLDSSSMYIGINETAPSDMLHITSSGNANVRVEGGTNSEAGIRLINDAQEWRIFTATTDILEFRDVTGGAGFMVVETGADANSIYIDDVGNVGVGENNPGATLHVYGDAENAQSINTSLTLGGSILLDDSTAGTGGGGAVLFGSNDDVFAAIKSDIRNAADFGRGNLWVLTRRDGTSDRFDNHTVFDFSGSMAILDGGLCVGDDDVGIDCTAADGSIYYDVNAPAAYDLAEEIGAIEKLSSGDVVIATGDEKIGRTSIPYDRRVVGVITTSPNVVFRSNGYTSLGDVNITINETSAPLTIAGRVPVKVTTENGPIAAGDPLTSSSTLGHAMKFELLDPASAQTFEELKEILSENERRRGAIIGKALESCADEICTIVTLVELH